MRIKIIVNSKIDGLGTKTIIFMDYQWETFIVSRDEGSHSEIDIGKKVYDAIQWDNPDCTL